MANSLITRAVAQVVEHGVVVPNAVVSLEQAPIERGVIALGQGNVGYLPGVMVEVDRIAPAKPLEQNPNVVGGCRPSGCRWHEPSKQRPQSARDWQYPKGRLRPLHGLLPAKGARPFQPAL